jgi:dTDP-glucose 4,6-dehydratase
MGVRFEELCEVTGDRLGQDSRYWLDSSRAERELGWKPSIGWEEGLAEMVVWGRQFREEICRTSTEYVLRA